MVNIYSSSKIFHFKDKLDSLEAGIDKILAPIHIRIKPTNMCNHDCSYCAYKSKELQLGKDMNMLDFIPCHKMMEIVDDIADMGVQAVTFSGGGEPLCYPYFVETLKKLIDYDIKFACLTNGACLSGEVADLLAKYGTWVRISIDGYDEESYMDYRGVNEGEFTRVMNNIEQFAKKKGRCLLGVSFIVDKRNANHIYTFLKQLKGIGVQTVKVSPCIVSNERKDNNIYHHGIFNHVKEQISRAINDIADEQYEIYDAYHKLDEKFDKDYTWCPYAQILPVIGADLNVYTCQDKAYNLECGILGSIKEIRFKEFWFKNKEVFYKINPSLQCNHHCVANTKNKQIFSYLSANNDHLAFV